MQVYFYERPLAFDIASRTKLRIRLSGSKLQRFSAGYEAYRDGLPDLRILGSGYVEFDRAVYDVDLAETLVRNLTGETLVVSPQTSTVGAPKPRILQASASDMDVLRRDHFTDTSINEEEVFIQERFIVNDAMARNRLQFTKKALFKFAMDFGAGRSVLLFHDQRQIEGRTFEASVVRRKREKREESSLAANFVRTKLFLPIAPHTESIITRLRFGIFAFDSIGFAGGTVEIVEEEVEGRDWPIFNVIIDRKKDEPFPLEGGETSFVFLGMMRGAGNEKLSSSLFNPDDLEPSVEPEAADDLSGGDPQQRGEEKSVVVGFL